MGISFIFCYIGLPAKAPLFCESLCVHLGQRLSVLELSLLAVSVAYLPSSQPSDFEPPGTLMCRAPAVLCRETRGCRAAKLPAAVVLCRQHHLQPLLSPSLVIPRLVPCTHLPILQPHLGLSEAVDALGHSVCFITCGMPCINTLQDVALKSFSNLKSVLAEHHGVSFRDSVHLFCLLPPDRITDIVTTGRIYAGRSVWVPTTLLSMLNPAAF